MSLPHALLGLIKYHPATGYQLKQAFDNSIHFFWNATLPQIYRTLNDMESKGWLTATIQHQDGKPSRKIYSVTPAGVAELTAWLAGPVQLPEPRLEMLVKVFFGNQMEQASFRDLVTQWRDKHAELLQMYEKRVAPVIDGYARMTGATEDARYWALTLDYGRRHAQMNVEWCEATLKALSRREIAGAARAKRTQGRKGPGHGSRLPKGRTSGQAIRKGRKP